MLVELSEVSHRFGSVTALDQINLGIPQGSVAVLLGPNGAGKTTAIRMLTGVLRPDQGTVRVFGLSPSCPRDGRLVRQRCGVVSAKPSLYDRLSGLDNLIYSADLYGVGPRHERDSRIREAADTFGIAHALAQPVGGYSTGMKTRLALARATIHQPDLLLLDEPTSGLDPRSALTVLELIAALAAQGRTVVMSTHLLNEADGLADQVIIMEQGTTVASGAPADLATAHWPYPQITIRAQYPQHLDRLATTPGVLDYRRQGTTAVATVDHQDRIADLVYSLTINGARLESVEPYRPSLEDTYFAVMNAAEPTASPLAPSSSVHRLPAAADYVGVERRART